MQVVNVPEAALRLKSIRKFKGLSQTSFAKQLGIPLRSYQYYETGERPIPSRVLQRLSEMGVSIHWLLTGNGEMFNPLQVVVAKINAMIKQQEVAGQLLLANLVRARAEVAARFGEGAAAEIFDGMMMPKEIPSVDGRMKVVSPKPSNK